MLFKGGGLFSVLLIVFAGWIFIASSDQERLVRACKPTQWVGGLAVSIVDLTAPKYSSTADGWITSLEYSCQYMLWRLFYEDAWLKYQEQAKENIYEAIEQTKQELRGNKRHHD